MLELCYAPFNGHVVAQLPSLAGGAWDTIVFNVGHHPAADAFQSFREYSNELNEKIKYFTGLKESGKWNGRTLWIDSAAFPHRIDDYAYSKGVHGGWGLIGDGRTNLRLLNYNHFAHAVLARNFQRKKFEEDGMGWIDCTLEIGRVWTDCATDNAHLDWPIWDAIANAVWERFLVKHSVQC